ncbi:hypothetical protein SUGI_0970380 [Cryptomeria japonica]|uniref:xyloglucan endotransglucosylase/hydrolase protein 4 n=1 Tax=Cryptomeria japonica TaxID=3369 RepID=UPI0024148FE0|nr:xyloglucan endotransglucosylase/hydrolase protein 4 [Cryptomeria japonica]GLJ46062.1 hypothetical protein SUGI_0970380 [Cryptomeria japonica]
MVNASPYNAPDRQSGINVLSAFHCWLVLSFFISIPSPLAMAAPADSSAYQCKAYETMRLREIAVDYTPEVCHHKPEEEEIAITFDERGGARWRTLRKYRYGSFSSRIKCPDGDTSGLNCSFYLSSLEGDKTQDEIDFEFLGKDKGIVQTNFYTEGTGNREQIHQLGFDCSGDFHEYTIRWGHEKIEWLVDGKIVRSDVAKEGERFPSKSMFLYASVWNASYIDEGRWAGPYFGHHAPYVCRYKDVHIPVDSEE